jgi:zinc and cadmium transporter
MHSSFWRILLAVVLGLAAAGADVAGGLLVVERAWKRRYLHYFIALGAGFMLATAFLEMMPASLEFTGNAALVLVLAGYLLVHFFEHTLVPHFHFGEETHAEEMARVHAGYAALLGLSIHTFFDGVAIASGLLVSTWLGAVIFLAVFLHKLPEGFTISSLMLASGQSRRTAFAAAAILGFSTLLGMALMALVRAEVGYALPLSAGVGVYVAATDLVPEVNREPGIGLPLVVFLGVGAMLLLRWLLRVP